MAKPTVSTTTTTTTSTAAATAGFSLPEQPPTTTVIISKEVAPKNAKVVLNFMSAMGIADSSVQDYGSKDTYSDIVGGLLKTDLVQRGRVSCVFIVLPVVTNFFNGLHGSAVAAVAERIAIACARTVVGVDKELFFGELCISYLSAAQQHEEMVVDGSVVRSGRNLSVIAIQFKAKKTGKLVYMAHATIYHMPAAKL